MRATQNTWWIAAGVGVIAVGAGAMLLHRSHVPVTSTQSSSSGSAGGIEQQIAAAQQQLAQLNQQASTLQAQLHDLTDAAAANTQRIAQLQAEAS